MYFFDNWSDLTSLYSIDTFTLTLYFSHHCLCHIESDSFVSLGYYHVCAFTNKNNKNGFNVCAALFHVGHVLLCMISFRPGVFNRYRGAE